MIVRRRRSLQAKATSYVLVAVLRFFYFYIFLFFFLLLTRLLSNGWADFHQIFFAVLFVNCGTPKIGAGNVYIWSENLDSGSKEEFWESLNDRYN